MTTKRKPDWADKTADRLNLIESSKGALKLVCGFDARMASALRAAYMRGVREERERFLAEVAILAALSDAKARGM